MGFYYTPLFILHLPPSPQGDGKRTKERINPSHKSEHSDAHSSWTTMIILIFFFHLSKKGQKINPEEQTLEQLLGL